MSATATAMFPAQTDPEHVLGRGFKINLSTTDLTIVDQEASTPPPIVLRSFWGKATLTARADAPYDFEPTVFSGTQLWDHRDLPVPPAVVSAFPGDAFGRGVGAYVSLDEFPGRYESMEFVFQRRPDLIDEPPLPEVHMAWVILDTRPVDLHPFVVAATRVLEPLIAELRRSLERANREQLRAICELHVRVEDLSTSVRDLQAQPSRMSAVIKTLLRAIGAIVLNIVANQLSPLVDEIDWADLYNMINEAIRRLALR